MKAVTVSVTANKFSSHSGAYRKFAKSKSNEDPLCEVLVEECGTEACFCLMKFSGKRNEFLDVID